MLKAKRCAHCKKVKKRKAYYRSVRAAHGLQAWCIACHKAKPRKREVVKFECDKCHRICERVAKPIYKEVLRRKVCCRCSRLERIARNGGHGHGYKGTQYFTGQLIGQWKLSATRRGHLWKVTNEDLDRIFRDQGGVCALSGMKMAWAGPPAYRPSIDRKDSSGSYRIENVQFVCSIVNIMKNKVSETEFIRICALIAAHRREETRA